MTKACFRTAYNHKVSKSAVLLRVAKPPTEGKIFVGCTQDVQSQCLAFHYVHPRHGVIDAHGSTVVEVDVKTSRLGHIQLPLFIHIEGSSSKPLQCILDVHSIGPNLTLGLNPSER